MHKTHVLGFAGYSGSGKTTLIEKLIPQLEKMGIRTAVIKHDAHGLRFDAEGKDSQRSGTERDLSSGTLISGAISGDSCCALRC